MKKSWQDIFKKLKERDIKKSENCFGKMKAQEISREKNDVFFQILFLH